MEYDFDQLAEAVFDNITDRIQASKLIASGVKALENCTIHTEANDDISAAEEQFNAIWLEEVGRAVGGNFEIARSVFNNYNCQVEKCVRVHQHHPNAMELIIQESRTLALREIKRGLKESCK